METEIAEDQLARFSEFVAEGMGLDFPPARWPELRRGIAAAAKTFGFDDPARCIQWMMSAPLKKNQIDELAGHLTVGETYFFRENRSFELLAERVLPGLARERGGIGGERRLRIWSAACCTGEEAYSIAILLTRTIPDWKNWNITILATDINPRFLRKAEAGLFGEWSFRDAPSWLRPQYFSMAEEGQYKIVPEIRRMVRFAQLNLAEDVYPSVHNDTNAMDIIFCRNVLMYFTAERAKKVIENLYRAQMEDGWLIVGAGEILHGSSGPYEAMRLNGATQYRKTKNARPAAELSEWISRPDWPAPAVVELPMPVVVEIGGVTMDVAGDGRAAQGPPLSVELNVGPAGQSARVLANQGRLAEALVCCEEWIAADKLNPSGHYLRAVVLQEQNAVDEAVRSLRTALYLDPKFVLAHFAMGNIVRRLGHSVAAVRHFQNTLQLLSKFQPDAVLPESDGITAARMTEIVGSLLNLEAA